MQQNPDPAPLELPPVQDPQQPPGPDEAPPITQPPVTQPGEKFAQPRSIDSARHAPERQRSHSVSPSATT